MEGKDDRSKSKRSKMKQHNYRKATRNTIATGGQTSSSSAREQTVRGVIDVADSSDERFTERGSWRGVAAQPMRAYDDALNEFDDMNNEQLHAPDFDQMAQVPTSLGGHFRFASEKSWDLAEDDQLLQKTQAGEYFTLNLKLLNVGLQTIPFYKRMEYSRNMFTSAQLKNMDKAAEAAESCYQQILKEHNDDIKNGKPSSAGVEQVATQLEKTTLTNEVNKENQTVENKAPAEAQEIQQWLDNVLDE